MLIRAALFVTALTALATVAQAQTVTPNYGQTLTTDRQAVQTDRQAVRSDYLQLRADQKAGNTIAVTTDQQNIATAKQTLQGARSQTQSDRQSYFGTSGGGNGGGFGRRR